MTTREQDIRLEILNTLLTTPHRELGKAWPVHRQMAEQDPRFYVRLAAWYNDHGDVRDHKELFVANLALSEDAADRDVGLSLLRGLPPYELVRVVDFIHGKKTTRKVPIAAKTERRRKARKRLGTEKGQAETPTAEAAPQFETKVEEFGLFRNVPRSVKTEVARYLAEREADPDWFDSTVLIARKALKRLYAVLHLVPGERAQKSCSKRTPRRAADSSRCASWRRAKIRSIRPARSSSTASPTASPRQSSNR